MKGNYEYSFSHFYGGFKCICANILKIKMSEFKCNSDYEGLLLYLSLHCLYSGVKNLCLTI